MAARSPFGQHRAVNVAVGLASGETTAGSSDPKAGNMYE